MDKFIMGEIHELSEKLKGVSLDDDRTAQFFVTMGLNQRDCDRARETVRAQFLRFIGDANTYIRQTSTSSGLEIVSPAAQLVTDESAFSVECGGKKNRAHVHALLVVKGRGRIMLDLHKMRQDFPHTHWDVKYVKQPRSVEETLNIMKAYMSKAAGDAGAGTSTPIRHVSPEEFLALLPRATMSGSTNNPRRRFAEIKSSTPVSEMVYTPFTDDLREMLSDSGTTSRRPRRGATFVFLVY